VLWNDGSLILVSKKTLIDIGYQFLANQFVGRGIRPDIKIRLLQKYRFGGFLNIKSQQRFSVDVVYIPFDITTIFNSHMCVD
jgi:hypothetical protein